MMMKNMKTLVCLCLFLFGIHPVAHAAESAQLQALLSHPLVVVMDFGTHKGATTADINLTAAEKASCDYVMERLVEDGRFEVMERDLMQEKLEAEQLNTTGLIDPDTARRIGAILGVRYIVYGNVTDMTASDTGTSIMGSGVKLLNVKSHIIARLMDVETGDILMASKGEGKSTSSLTKIGTEELGTITIGTQKVSQESVHNALQKAAYAAVDTMLERLYGKKKAGK